MTPVMGSWLDCWFPAVTNATTTSCAFQSPAIVFTATDTIHAKKKPSSKLSRISETTHMPRPQLVICYLVPFKVGPFHQEGSVRSTSIRCFRLNNVPLSCCHMDALWSILLHAWAGPCWCWHQCKVMHERYFQEPVKQRLKNVYKEWPEVTGNTVSHCSDYSSA